ncbi:ornithine cyclodeaminase [Dethiosulfatibacter aminovorans DSM 17477]|uniref:Ornithine cyclodeaminase n=1 Tax=Dethiosulfatibacter aminovorans DSM 17477 TaxID=1121476 RepID=A0A1M6HAS9_9FIRM|nr:ornithine cyclodeaminase family protein [Dethiosulfatibacter aminovorans]SHJ19332.1 ornithine cyclodeaminase [Dethiosulfatibacter aminovorans DSM 17477]
MLVIGKEEVRELLSMKECIELMKGTLMDLNEGKASMSLRSMNKLAGDDFYLLMPAYLNEKGYFGVKLITILPSNHAKNLPSHQGVVLLFSAEDGQEKATIDCISITALRTASVTAVATDLLARKDANKLGFLGAGVQARNHVESLMLVRDVEEIRVWDLHKEAAEKFAEEMSEKHNVKVIVCNNAEEVVSNSDVVTTVTLAKEPVLKGEWLKPGTHINAIGASAKAYREIDSDAVAQARLYVDKKESCTGESSDYLVPLSEGKISDDHIVAEIGDVLLGKAGARETDTEITMFEGMGLAVEDIASATYIYQKAAGIK